MSDDTTTSEADIATMLREGYVCTVQNYDPKLDLWEVTWRNSDGVQCGFWGSQDLIEQLFTEAATPMKTTIPENDLAYLELAAKYTPEQLPDYAKLITSLVAAYREEVGVGDEVENLYARVEDLEFELDELEKERDDLQNELDSHACSRS